MGGRTIWRIIGAGRLSSPFFANLTPAVTQELCALRDKMPDFDRSGAKVFAIGALSAGESKAFHDVNKLNYPILRDPQAQSAKIYGAVDEEKHIRTASFAVDGSGTVMLALPGAQIDAPRHGAQSAEFGLLPLRPHADERREHRRPDRARHRPASRG